METGKFLGIDVPKNIGYEVFPAHVSVYRRNSAEGVWGLLGVIAKPYEKQSKEWWLQKFEKLSKKFI